MQITRLPVLDGIGAEAAIKELKSYIVRLDRQLSLLLSNVGQEDLAPSLKLRLYDELDRNMGGVKNQIIETAQEIRELSDRIELKLQSDYVAKGELGEYTEQAIQNITVDGKGITQLFEEVTSLAERVDGAEDGISDNADASEVLSAELKRLGAYVRTGKLEDGIYGIEIGSFSSGGEAPYKVRLSDNRLSFFVGNAEAAYFSDDSMYIDRASVPSVLTVGSCSVKNEHGLTFTAE